MWQTLESVAQMTTFLRAIKRRATATCRIGDDSVHTVSTASFSAQSTWKKGIAQRVSNGEGSGRGVGSEGLFSSR